mmetsp:Transcript_41205/g.73899  ORF Transcript_41205/g.73899 Transcript_41205/m.73899 type:complete len:248 (+) Transcript_41205:2986-3729(+)
MGPDHPGTSAKVHGAAGGGGRVAVHRAGPVPHGPNADPFHGPELGGGRPRPGGAGGPSPAGGRDVGFPDQHLRCACDRLCSRLRRRQGAATAVAAGGAHGHVRPGRGIRAAGTSQCRRGCPQQPGARLPPVHGRVPGLRGPAAGLHRCRDRSPAGVNRGGGGLGRMAPQRVGPPAHGPAGGPRQAPGGNPVAPLRRGPGPAGGANGVHRAVEPPRGPWAGCRRTQSPGPGSGPRARAPGRTCGTVRS